MIISHTKGHSIYYVGGEWLYLDNNTSIKQIRNCKHCNKPSTNEGHDFCLGKIKNVIAACCGHGNKSKRYIKYK